MSRCGDHVACADNGLCDGQDGDPVRHLSHHSAPMARPSSAQVIGVTLHNGFIARQIASGGKALVCSPHPSPYNSVPLTPRNTDIALHVELEVSLPPLPAHLSHLPAPSAPLLRPNTLTSALNPFLVHRSAGLPPLSWDLRVAAHAVLFPVSGPGGPAVPMPTSDYAQPATWPPCGALRIGAIGGHAGWRWPVEARNPAGVRCGDVFRALVANLHSYVRQDELADMPPEHITVVAAACTARVATGFPPGSSSSESSAAPDGIRRVDCLMGYTHFHGLEPGPGTGEWTMFVGAP